MSSEQWNSAAVWPANSATQNISYDQQAKANRKHFEDCDIFIPKNLHAYRQSAAQDLDDQGMADSVSCRSLPMMIGNGIVRVQHDPASCAT